MEILSLIALTIFFVVCSFLLYSHRFRNDLPPGPLGLPILGYLPFLKPNLHHHFTHLAHKYGPIYKLWLGSKLCVVISSPALVKQVVRDNDVFFANRDPPAAAIIATGGVDIAWSSYGPYWRDMRKLFVREMLSNKNLQASSPLRKEEVRRAVGNLRAMVGQPVDIGKVVFSMEVKVIMNLLWGETMEGEMRDRVGEEFRGKTMKLVDLLGKPNVSDFLPGLGKFDLQGVAKEMRGVVAGVEEILDYVIREGTDRIKGKDFLGILLGMQGREVGETTSFGLTQIKAIVMDIVIGGTDTTTTTVEWVMAVLLHNPTVMEKVEKEVIDVVGMSSIVEEHHTSKLQYLEAVVKETFRLHPPLPLLVPRLPSKSCKIGGYMVPKGCRVFLNMWSIYRDPEVWESPLEFKPERFLDGNRMRLDYMGNSVEYLPFGSGRRVCPGILLAKRMMMYSIATLVHSFKWKLEEGQVVDLSEKFGIIMRKNTPLIAIPHQRLSSLDLYS